MIAKCLNCNHEWNMSTLHRPIETFESTEVRCPKCDSTKYKIVDFKD